MAITVDLGCNVVGGVESVTGNGVGGTSSNVVMTYPTPGDIGAIEPTDYATSTVGGTLKARLDGTTLYLTNDGTDA